MGSLKGILSHLLLGGLLILAAEPVCAQGFHFGGGFGGGFRFGGPGFGGPRYDGPGYDGPGYDGPGYGAPEYDGPSPDNPRFRDSVDAPPLREPSPADLGGARKCFTPAETRQRVAQLKLREPFEMMRRAGMIANAQALAGRLCRWADLDVYDISLLRPNGRVVHVFLDALTGRVVGESHIN